MKDKVIRKLKGYDRRLRFYQNRRLHLERFIVFLKLFFLITTCSIIVKSFIDTIFLFPEPYLAGDPQKFLHISVGITLFFSIFGRYMTREKKDSELEKLIYTLSLTLVIFIYGVNETMALLEPLYVHYLTSFQGFVLITKETATKLYSIYIYMTYVILLLAYLRTTTVVRHISDKEKGATS